MHLFIGTRRFISPPPVSDLDANDEAADREFGGGILVFIAKGCHVPDRRRQRDVSHAGLVRMWEHVAFAQMGRANPFDGRLVRLSANNQACFDRLCQVMVCGGRCEL